MNFVNFFAQVANNFKNHYQQLAESVRLNRTPEHYYSSVDKAEQPKETAPTDSYVPSEKTKPETEVPTAETEQPKTDNPTYTNPTEQNEESLPAETEKGNVAYFMRKARLDYKMALEFDLAAIQSIAERIADGETEEISEFAAAGFGLRAAFDIKGMEIIETNMADKLDYNGQVHFRSKNRSVFAGKFGAQSKNFDLQSFYRESTDVSRSMNVEVFDNYRRAVNKFALRYRLDNNFGFAFANRFNVQTRQIAETDPANLNNYVTTAGNVAEKGTTEMMATFFDAVDEYLASAESGLLAKADEFYTMAVEQLGFAEETAAMVKDKLVNSIESFFVRVNDAVDMLSSKFVAPEPELPDVEVELPEIPTTTEDKTELAMA